MFGLDFNDLRDLAWISCFLNAGWHIEHNREQYAKAKRPSHKRAYLRWQVTSIRDMDRCYDALAARPIN
ncbi:hypothetical protein CIW54_07755 [Paraburkholderia sp. T12-10]|nr:hypothetical protein CIW54_07755 [Paraburkholderia sp. T12-10]